jgi:hypothetical protein
MRITAFAFLLAVASFATGCAAGFRASGPNGGGVGAGAEVGPPALGQPVPRP